MILWESNEGPDQTAQMRSLIWAFVVHIYDTIPFLVSRRDFCKDRN